MTILRVDNFGGMIPRVADKALPVNAAIEAINCDLRGGEIKPYGTFGTVKTLGARGAVANGTKFLEQIPSVVAAVTNSVAAASVQFSPPLGNYVVAASDELWYAVYLPNIPATNPAGGCGNINLTFTDGTTLGAGVVDQNALSATAGNLVNNASGQWYARKIPIAGMLASDGAAITGKTINGVRLYMNNSDTSPKVAYYGPVFVMNAGAFKGVLLDMDRQQDPSSIATKGFDYMLIDEDEQVFDGFMAAVYPTGNSAALHQAMMFRHRRVPFSGFERNKQLIATTYLRGADFPVNIGRSNHDNFAPMFDTANPTLDYSILNDWSWRQNELYATNVIVNHGWIGVVKPTAAMTTSSISGGVGATVSRSYVFTHVSEDGLESAPSPVHGPISGRVDDTWTLNVPTWNGTDQFGRSTPAGSMLHQRRVYRTPAGDSVYKLVGTLDDNDTTIADTVLDTALGAELETTEYQNPPIMQDVAYWRDGIAACLTQGNTVAFCVPYEYHAWPLTHRYILRNDGVRIMPLGERMVALTKGRPEIVYGNDPALLQVVPMSEGEPCINADSAHETPSGVVYVGRTGWGRVTLGGGYENITAAFFKPDQFYSALDSTGLSGLVLGASSLISAVDGERLIWGSQGTATGYILDLVEGKLAKFEFPQSLYALSYYAPRNTLWAAYTSGTDRAAAKVFGASTSTVSNRLKWTWKSKFLRTARPVSFAVAQVESTEWSSLTNSMKYRDGFRRSIPAWATGIAYEKGAFVTESGSTYRCDVKHTSGVFLSDLALTRWVLTNTVYTISITGLTQSELWCFLTVYADADNANTRVTVYEDFVPSDRPVVFAGDIISDCWQFEIRGNINVSEIVIAETERELNEA